MKQWKFENLQDLKYSSSVYSVFIYQAPYEMLIVEYAWNRWYAIMLQDLLPLYDNFVQTLSTWIMIHWLDAMHSVAVMP